MVTGGRQLRRAFALALACAGAITSVAATPVTDRWTADPDEQFLLDVTIRQLRLGDGVRAYQTPEGSCIMFGDFVGALDVPIEIDLGAGRASGWAFDEKRRIEIDTKASQVRFSTSAEPLTARSLRVTPDGWCVDSAALARWFGIGVRPMTAGAALMLESKTKLPVELAIERRKRAERLTPAKFSLDSLPQVRLPYRMWRAPALDFIVSAGATYRASDGLRVDRQSSVHAAGEIAKLSYDARLSTDPKGRPSTLRMRAYRSDPDGGLLGPLGATHAAAGDVEGFHSPLGAAGLTGRGAMVTNRPLFTPTSFGRTRFEGDLPAGWEAEIYRNGELIGFARPTAGQRYVFEDVQLLYGENQVSVVLYGPQGQIRTHDEMINVGRDNVPAGKTWYWAGFNQPGRELVALHPSPDALKQPDLQASLSVEHGLDGRTSVGALARMLLDGDQKVTFVEGSVRRSVGSALIEVAAARDSGGGTAARAQLIAQIGSVHVNAEALATEDFPLDRARRQTLRDVRAAVDAPIRLGRTVIPAHADVRVRKNGDGASQLEAAARLSAYVERFNLSSEVRYRRDYLDHGPSPPGRIETAFIGSGRVGDVRVRATASSEVAPSVRFRSAELSAYWSASDEADWEGALAYDAGSSRARARVSHVRRFDSMAVALTGEAATDGSLALGFNLNFSLDPGRGMKLYREPLAGAGSVRARVYRDLNDNGVRDTSEPDEEGAMITAGSRLIEKPTDSKGAVMVGGLQTYAPLTVGIDMASLDDPMLVPKKALQVVVPRPGVPATVEIGLVGGGDIEGAVVKSGGLGFEGLDLELVGADGKVVATARSDFDGFFLFERVPYGEYRVRLSAASAEAGGVMPELGLTVAVSADQSVVRLGSVVVRPVPNLATLE